MTGHDKKITYQKAYLFFSRFFCNVTFSKKTILGKNISNDL